MGGATSRAKWPGPIAGIVVVSMLAVLLLAPSRPAGGAESWLALSPVQASVSGSSAVPPQTEVGQTVAFRVSFSNTGSTTWTFYAGVTLRRPDGSLVNVAPITPVRLSPGQEGSATWNYEMDQAGDWDAAYGIWREAEETNPLAFTGWSLDCVHVHASATPVTTVTVRIDSHSGSPQQTQARQSVTFRVVFSNTGSTAWTFYAALSLRRPDGSQVNVVPLIAVPLSPGRQGSADWNCVMDQAGDWSAAYGIWKDSDQTTALLHTGWSPSRVRVSPAPETGSLLAQEAVRLARSVIGAPYVWGAKGRHWDKDGHSDGGARWATPDEILRAGYERTLEMQGGESKTISEPGLDCSGLVMWAYNYAYDPGGVYIAMGNPVFREGAGGQWADRAHLAPLAVLTFSGDDAPEQFLNRLEAAGPAALGLCQGDVIYFLLPGGVDEDNHVVLYAGDGKVIHATQDVFADVSQVFEEPLQTLLERYVDHNEFTTVGVGWVKKTLPRVLVGSTGVGGQPSFISALVPGALKLFNDLAGVVWAQDAIDSLATMGIAGGVGGNLFDPGGPVTRAQLAAFLQRAFSLSEPSPPLPFTDVPRDNWAYAPVQAAGEYVGYYGQAGSSAVTFRPNAKSTREDVAMAIVKALAAEQAIDILDTEAAASEVLSQFKDAATISPGRRVYMATAVRNGILRGLPGDVLNPTAGITRAEVAGLLDRALVSFLLPARCSAQAERGCTVRVFVDAMLPYASRVSEKTGVSEEFVLAHWGHESGWGLSPLARHNLNFAGIKKRPDHPVGELHPSYAAYESLGDFMQDYIDTISQDRYEGVLKAAREGASAEVLAGMLLEAGYCEDEDYGSKVGGAEASLMRYLP